jgi:mannitol/fructose-specific phosphotransferase system IIA component (Ntr-type)
MKLCEILRPENIFIGLKAANKEELIHFLMKALHTGEIQLDADAIEQKLLAREREISTGIGHGVGIPHINHAPISDIFLAAATLDPPVPYAAIDQQPVSLIFLVLTGTGQAGRHLKILARISRMSHKEEVLNSLKNAPDAQVFLETLEQFESRYPEL